MGTVVSLEAQPVSLHVLLQLGRLQQSVRVGPAQGSEDGWIDFLPEVDTYLPFKKPVSAFDKAEGIYQVFPTGSQR